MRYGLTGGNAWFSSLYGIGDYRPSSLFKYMPF